MYNIELPQNFASNFNEKRHQVRKAENKQGARGIQKSEIIHRI